MAFPPGRATELRAKTLSAIVDCAMAACPASSRGVARRPVERGWTMASEAIWNTTSEDRAMSADPSFREPVTEPLLELALRLEKQINESRRSGEPAAVLATATAAADTIERLAGACS